MSQLSEFNIISRYFENIGITAPAVDLGIGDDCALLQPLAGMQVAITVDTLNSGVHFFPDCDPLHIGHKALAVNLSDLAAMGAKPWCFTLALSLPEVATDWLASFAQGLQTLATSSGIRLIGGDTTQGALSITIQAMGLLPAGTAVRRSGAQVGDYIMVSGHLGDAALALMQLKNHQEPDVYLRRRLECPTPRIALGQQLRGLAHAMIDLSDGLAGDLGHILACSGVGARLELAKLPLSVAIAQWVAEQQDWSLPLQAGDDYELCFTIAPERLDEVSKLATTDCPLTKIGVVTAELGLSGRTTDGQLISLAPHAYEHFH